MSARKKKKKPKSKQRRVPKTARVAAPASASGAVASGAVASTSKALAKPDTFLADIRKEKAAQLLAEKEDTVEVIAAAVGVCRETLYAWQKDSAFAARVAEISRDLASHARRYLIARRSWRLANLQGRLQRMQRLLDARAADPALQSAPGGDTGLMVRRQRMLGSGENAVLVEDYEFDAALDKAMRDTERQAAQECGQWINKVAPTTPDGNDQYNGIAAPDLDDFRKLPVAERIRLLRQAIRIPPGDRVESSPES